MREKEHELFKCKGSASVTNADEGGGSTTATKCEDPEILPEETGFTLTDCAARVVMKVLYTARVARPDILRTVGFWRAILQSGTKYVTREYTD